MKQQRIAIIGTGTAGSASALFLSRQGHQVTVFEKISHPSAVGAGLLLQPTGLYVLDELGLGERIRTLGAHVEQLNGRTRRNHPVITLNYSNLKPDYHGTGIHRAALFSTLHNALNQTHTTIKTGVEVNHYQQSPNSVTLFDTTQQSLGDFDAVIIANGARSHLRTKHPYITYDKEYPWGALWAIVEQKNDINPHCLRQTYHTAQYMVGALPTGRLPSNNTPLVSLFWSIPTVEFSRWQNGQVDFKRWRQHVVKLAPYTRSIMAQLHEPSQLAFATYRDVTMKQWHDHRVVFIGDAAHSMSPQLGQGANLALCDALVLSHCIQQSETIANALKRYNEQRKSHLQFYQTMSHWLTPFYQSKNHPFAWARDALSAPLTRIPWIQQQMLLTLTGLKTGWIQQTDMATLFLEQSLSQCNQSEQ